MGEVQNMDIGVGSHEFPRKCNTSGASKAHYGGLGSQPQINFPWEAYFTSGRLGPRMIRNILRRARVSLLMCVFTCDNIGKDRIDFDKAVVCTCNLSSYLYLCKAVPGCLLHKIDKQNIQTFKFNWNVYLETYLTNSNNFLWIVVTELVQKNIITLILAFNWEHPCVICLDRVFQWS